MQEEVNFEVQQKPLDPAEVTRILEGEVRDEGEVSEPRHFIAG